MSSRQIRAHSVTLVQAAGMTAAFDLGLLGPAFERRSPEWDRLAITCSVPSDPTPYDKASSFVRFEGSNHGGQFILWDSGEADLEVFRLSDMKMLARTYLLTSPDDLTKAVDDIVSFVDSGTVPPGAYVHDISQ